MTPATTLITPLLLRAGYSGGESANPEDEDERTPVSAAVAAGG